MAKLVAANGLLWNINKLNTYLDQTDGVASGTGVSTVQGLTAIQTAVLKLTNTPIPTVDATTNGAQGSLKVFTFPAGVITIVGASTDLTIARVGTAIAAGAAVVGAVGSVTAGVDATLTSTEANIVGSTVSTLTAGAGVTKGVNGSPVTLNGTQTNAAAWLNFAIPDADSSGNDTLTVNGTITINYLLSGDN